VGFRRAVIPTANAPKKPLADIEVVAVTRIGEALDVLFD
jgi:DNA repair protein RadA/Sms